MSLDKNEEERYSHPSFGMIGFSRVSSSGNNAFFGSELKQDHFITMKIHPASITRSLSRDWYHAGHTPIVEIRLTSNQFSEMLTSLNRGDGVPCTIEIANNQRVEQMPQQESRKEFIHRKFEDRMREFAKTLKQKQLRVRELTAKKTLSKEDQRELNMLVEWLTQEVASNIPFFAKCFQETIDYSVNEAKSEIENAIQHKINVLGLEALHEQNNLLKS